MAISYCAVNLVTYSLMQLAEPAGVPKTVAMAVLGIWGMVRRIRAKFE